jgi:hypothetical protein
MRPAIIFALSLMLILGSLTAVFAVEYYQGKNPPSLKLIISHFNNHSGLIDESRRSTILGLHKIRDGAYQVIFQDNPDKSPQWEHRREDLFNVLRLESDMWVIQLPDDPFGRFYMKIQMLPQ